MPYSPEERREIMAKADAILAETAPAAQRNSAAVHARDGAGGLVFKTREARVDGSGSRIAHKTSVADDDGAAVERTPSARNSKQSRWEWTDARIESHLSAFGEEVAEKFGAAMAEWVGGKVDPIKRELALLRREFTVLREEVALERGLRDLRAEVAEARKEVPKLPAIAAQFDARQADVEGKQARLERELAKTKERVSNLRVDQSVDHHSISQLEKAASKTTASIEMETSTARFALRNIDPDAAKTLREFASQVVDARDGGAIWGRCLTQFEATAGTA